MLRGAALAHGSLFQGGLFLLQGLGGLLGGVRFLLRALRHLRLVARNLLGRALRALRFRELPLVLQGGSDVVYLRAGEPLLEQVALMLGLAGQRLGVSLFRLKAVFLPPEVELLF